MSGIDWKTAKIDQRELFSFSAQQVAGLDERICTHQGVNGCVLLATCNRTELYLTVEEEFYPNPAALLCAEAGVPFEPFRGAFHTRSGYQVVRHLMEVACGLRSQVLGEDQIVTQVKTASETAHQAGAADSVLQTLFRLAATAGKEVKGRVRLTAVPLSVASRAVELLAACGPLTGKRAVVIGNGEMGRLASTLLVDAGCDVTVTLRSYRHGETIVPRGCNTAPYDNRLDAIEGSDILLSATTSPHFTITKDQLSALNAPPSRVADLAMPRDIDPAVKEMPNIRFFDMDCMGAAAPEEENAEGIQEIHEIIEKKTAEFYQWWDYKRALPLIEELKELAVGRALGAQQFDKLCEHLSGDALDAARQGAAYAAEKTVELLLGGMKAAVTPEILGNCRNKLIERAPKRSLAAHKKAEV